MDTGLRRYDGISTRVRGYDDRGSWAYGRESRPRCTAGRGNAPSGYSALIPAALMIFANLSMSDLMVAEKCSGESPIAS